MKMTEERIGTQRLNLWKIILDRYMSRNLAAKTRRIIKNSAPETDHATREAAAAELIQIIETSKDEGEMLRRMEEVEKRNSH